MNTSVHIFTLNSVESLLLFVYLVFKYFWKLYLVPKYILKYLCLTLTIRMCTPHRIPRVLEQQGWSKRKKDTRIIAKSSTIILMF